MYEPSIDESKKISKLLNAFGDKNKRPHNEQRSWRVEDIAEPWDRRDGGKEGKGRRWREDDEA